VLQACLNYFLAEAFAIGLIVAEYLEVGFDRSKILKRGRAWRIY
jgi:hypothetical protein